MKQKEKKLIVRDYSAFTMEEIQREFLKLHELSLTNFDIGATQILEQSFHIISEQLELIEEMKLRTGMTSKELDKIFVM